tara:strand:- start:5986 stop:7530 length:1545 start_codon:yes stop_codon:yes gene_type:complete
MWYRLCVGAPIGGGFCKIIACQDLVMAAKKREALIMLLCKDLYIHIISMQSVSSLHPPGSNIMASIKRNRPTQTLTGDLFETAQPAGSTNEQASITHTIKEPIMAAEKTTKAQRVNANYKFAQNLEEAIEWARGGKELVFALDVLLADELIPDDWAGYTDTDEKLAERLCNKWQKLLDAHQDDTDPTQPGGGKVEMPWGTMVDGEPKSPQMASEGVTEPIPTGTQVRLPDGRRAVVTDPGNLATTVYVDGSNYRYDVPTADLVVIGQTIPELKEQLLGMFTDVKENRVEVSYIDSRTAVTFFWIDGIQYRAEWAHRCGSWEQYGEDQQWSTESPLRAFCEVRGLPTDHSGLDKSPVQSVTITDGTVVECRDCGEKFAATETEKVKCPKCLDLDLDRWAVMYGPKLDGADADSELKHGDECPHCHTEDALRDCSIIGTTDAELICKVCQHHPGVYISRPEQEPLADLGAQVLKLIDQGWIVLAMGDGTYSFSRQPGGKDIVLGARQILERELDSE